MDFKDEIRELRRQGLLTSVGRYISCVERFLKREIHYREEVIAELVGAIRYARGTGQNLVILEYENLSEDECEIISMCEVWLMGIGFKFLSETTQERWGETVVILIAVADVPQGWDRALH